VGRAIGVLPVLALTAASMIGGVILLRRQGAVALARWRANHGARAETLADGALVAIAALLMIVPGLLTTAAGLVLLAPAMRARILRRLRRATAAAGWRQPAGAQVVELRPDEYVHAPRADSPWRRGG
jgi:UPF0716 protein FxsA